MKMFFLILSLFVSFQSIANDVETTTLLGKVTQKTAEGVSMETLNGNTIELKTAYAKLLKTDSIYQVKAIPTSEPNTYELIDSQYTRVPTYNCQSQEGLAIRLYQMGAGNIDTFVELAAFERVPVASGECILENDVYQCTFAQLGGSPYAVTKITAKDIRSEKFDFVLQKSNKEKTAIQMSCSKNQMNIL